MVWGFDKLTDRPGCPIRVPLESLFAEPAKDLRPNRTGVVQCWLMLAHRNLRKELVPKIMYPVSMRAATVQLESLAG